MKPETLSEAVEPANHFGKYCGTMTRAGYPCPRRKMLFSSGCSIHGKSIMSRMNDAVSNVVKNLRESVMSDTPIHPKPPTYLPATVETQGSLPTIRILDDDIDQARDRAKRQIARRINWSVKHAGLAYQIQCVAIDLLAFQRQARRIKVERLKDQAEAETKTLTGVVKPGIPGNQSAQTNVQTPPQAQNVRQKDIRFQAQNQQQNQRQNLNRK